MNHVVLTPISACLFLLSLLFPVVTRAEDVPQLDDPLPGDLPMIVAVQVPAWEVHMGSRTNGNYGAMPVDSIDFSIMTHYISFAAGLDTTGSAMRWNNIVTSRRQPLNDRIHAAGKPALLCIGGRNSDGYLTKALSPANRATAINTILSAMRTYGYDGIDWDWEPFSVSDSANLFPVIRTLHDSFQTMNAVWDPTKRPTQTADINPGNGSGQSNAWKRITPYLDFIMVMAYDKIGSWTRMVYFDYAPYSRIDNVIVDRIPGGGQEMATAQRQALQLTGAGLPAEKIVLGIDFMAGMASGGDGTSTGGATWPRQTWVTVPSFRADYKFDDFYKQYLDTASAAIKHWDDTSKAYFLSIDKPGSPDDRFISYAGGPGEDSTLFHHIELVRELGIGGMMVWDLSEAYLGTGKFPASSYPNIERNWLTHQLRKHLVEVTPPSPEPDTVAPSVAFVTPADGDSLTGNVTVEASASDNVDVSRVQFLLDGYPIGGPDYSAPYSFLWNTDLHT
ncbi:MAG TPA: glycosyl hydrolase family 18 protein, partial [Bacteroidota bacterium]|nr:glycosyl hydrolase family 18 protein [Bacteroidota bacterium]